MNEQKTQWGKLIFVFAVVGFCLITASRMAFDPTLTSKVSEIVADGFISIALFVSVSLLAAQTVDMSGVLTKVGSRFGGKPVSPVPSYETVDPRIMEPEAKG